LKSYDHTNLLFVRGGGQAESCAGFVGEDGDGILFGECVWSVCKWPRAKSWSKTRIRETLIIYVAKSPVRMALVRAWPKAGIRLALIPNETNKVRSHKNYPKYLEYNKVIHIGLINNI
jgi:hypothetical protein